MGDFQKTSFAHFKGRDRNVTTVRVFTFLVFTDQVPEAFGIAMNKYIVQLAKRIVYSRTHAKKVSHYNTNSLTRLYSTGQHFVY